MRNVEVTYAITVGCLDNKPIRKAIDEYFNISDCMYLASEFISGYGGAIKIKTKDNYFFIPNCQLNLTVDFLYKICWNKEKEGYMINRQNIGELKYKIGKEEVVISRTYNNPENNKIEVDVISCPKKELIIAIYLGHIKFMRFERRHITLLDWSRTTFHLEHAMIFEEKIYQDVLNNNNFIVPHYKNIK